MMGLNIFFGGLSGYPLYLFWLKNGRIGFDFVFEPGDSPVQGNDIPGVEQFFVPTFVGTKNCSTSLVVIPAKAGIPSYEAVQPKNKKNLLAKKGYRFYPGRGKYLSSSKFIRN